MKKASPNMTTILDLFREPVRRCRIDHIFAGLRQALTLIAILLPVLIDQSRASECRTSNVFVGTCEDYHGYAKACGPYLEKSKEWCGGMTGTGIAGCTRPLTAA